MNETSRLTENICRLVIGPESFLNQLGEGKFDHAVKDELLGSVRQLRDLGVPRIFDRLPIACLFDLVWELEGIIADWNNRGLEEAVKLTEVREEIKVLLNELLWSGLEEIYGTNTQAIQ